jgi:hypothetical protein
MPASEVKSQRTSLGRVFPPTADDPSTPKERFTCKLNEPLSTWLLVASLCPSRVVLNNLRAVD